MNTALLYKEWRLTAHPSVYVFLFFGALIFIPNYPYGMMYFFGCLGLYSTCLLARENRDFAFAALLPLCKKDYLKGRWLLFISAELLQMVIAACFAVLKGLLPLPQNPVGIEANIAWIGFGLMIYAVFNAVFLNSFARFPEKVGHAFIISGIWVIFMIVLMEGIAHIPELGWIDSIARHDLICQIPVLAAGIILYIAVNARAFKKSLKTFEKTD